MGLDMFLTGKYYIWRSNQDEVEVKGVDLHGFRLKEVCIEVGYWRKANQIHRWFVENIQEGIDECQESYVSRDDLEELLNLCKTVLVDKEHAKILLPTQEGFFFGNIKYGECYFENIENTIKIIEKALTLPEDWDFYYETSW